MMTWFVDEEEINTPHSRRHGMACHVISIQVAPFYF
jgi:hypothetical protein